MDVYWKVFIPETLRAVIELRWIYMTSFCSIYSLMSRRATRVYQVMEKNYVTVTGYSALTWTIEFWSAFDFFQILELLQFFSDFIQAFSLHSSFFLSQVPTPICVFFIFAFLTKQTFLLNFDILSIFSRFSHLS